MKLTTKNILAAIPLVAGLAGPATAALSESGDAGGFQGTPVTIEGLLNRFSGITPGEHSSAELENRNSHPNQQLSSFTSAGAAMSSYYTVLGGEQVFSGPTNSVHASVAGDAAAPTALSSVIHLAPESLSAVATGISPSTASQPYQTNNANPNPSTGSGTSTVTITTTIIPADPTPVPLPAAVVLLGSGLAALVPLRKRSRKTLVPVT